MRYLLFILFFSVGAVSDQLEIKITLSPAGSFSVKSNSLKIESELKVTKDGFSAKKISLPIDSLETGISLRNNHMKSKYFEVAQYPNAVLTDASGSLGKFKGLLEVHGIQKEINGKYRLKNGVLEAKFQCRLSDFKIKEANYMGVGVEDEVMVFVSIPIKE